jgi:hypothetical protein
VATTSYTSSVLRNSRPLANVRRSSRSMKGRVTHRGVAHERPLG